MSSPLPPKDLCLPSLSIKNFRGIQDLVLPRLGRVTLMAGKNNTGKTSILEAVRLLVESATPGIIGEILQGREKVVADASRYEETQNTSEEFLISPLFHGFPEIDEESAPIVVATCANSRQIRMKAIWGWFQSDERGNRLLVPLPDDAAWDAGDTPALVVKTANRERIHSIEQLDRLVSRRRDSPYASSTRKSSLFVNSASMERTEMLGELWDDIALTVREPYLVEALQILDENITAVAMIGERSSPYRPSRRAMVRSDEFPSRRVPLRSFGDGMNRLFGIILALLNVSSGGILLVDEFENGMHHTVQVHAWNMVFRLAQKLNVQVLATTHSFDCIAAFAQVATDVKEVDGLMVRVERFGDAMRVVEYTEQNLQVAARQRIEVR